MVKLFSLMLLCLCPFAVAHQPLVSIITSVYNSDQFIEGFMADIVQQTVFDQCELILINANSPGNEEEIICRYLREYPNIMYIKLDQDPGLYAVWNMAIRMARAEFITNANLDDRLKFDCYEKHLHALITHPEIDLVYSDFYVTYNPNETFDATQYHHIRTVPEFSRQAMAQPLPNNHPMWRKSLHQKYGYFDETFKHVGDYEMWLRAVEGGAQFLKVPGILGLYYYNPLGLSTNKKMQRITQEEERIFERYGYMFSY